MLATHSSVLHLAHESSSQNMLFALEIRLVWEPHPRCPNRSALWSLWDGAVEREVLCLHNALVFIVKIYCCTSPTGDCEF